MRERLAGGDSGEGGEAHSCHLSCAVISWTETETDPCWAAVMKTDA